MNFDADGSNRSVMSWAFRLKDIYWPSAPSKSGDEGGPEIIPPDERKAAMTRLDAQEVKLSLAAFVLATIAGVAIPAYIIATNKVTRQGKNTIAVAPDAWLLGGAILMFCVIGFVLLWKRRRSLIAFDLFLIGFGFTLFIGLIGFVFILLGAWLLLHAWRINKYGTTNAKVIAKESAARRKGGTTTGSTKEAKSSKSRATYEPGPRKPPTASKRYTPKSPPRKKIPKPTQ